MSTVFIQKWLSANSGFLLYLGGVYTKTSRIWEVVKYFNSLLLLFHFFCLLYTVYICILEKEIDIIIESLHHIVFVFAIICFVLECHRKEAVLSSLFRYLGSGGFKYQYIDEESRQEMSRMKRKMRERVRMLTGGFTWICFTCFVTVIIVRPCYDFMTKTGEVHHDNIIRSTPAPIWYPVDTQQWWGTVIAFVGINASAVFLGTHVVSLDCLYIRLSEQLCAEFEVLKITLHRFVERAGNTGSGKTKLADIEASLQECVQHHYLLNELFYKMQSFIYWWVLLGLLGCSYMLCLSGILFIQKNMKLSLKLESAIFLLTELAHCYISCWYGQKFRNLSEDISSAIYNSRWMEHSKQVKCYIIMIQARNLKPLQLSAGGLMGINLETYSKVVNSAFSYFNLLRAFRE